MNPTRRSTRFSRALLFAMAALALLVFVPTAGANIGGFEGGDGNQAAANCATALDWACLTASDYRAVADLVAPNDDLFTSSKLDDPDHWDFVFGTAGATKADVQAAWAAGVSKTAGNFFQLAFKRLDASGDTNIGIELNQNQQLYTNHAAHPQSVICRKDGDVLLSFDLNGTTVTPTIYRWTVSGAQPVGCSGSNGSFVAETPTAAQTPEMSISQTTFPTAIAAPGFAVGTSFPAGTFGEAAVDLNKLADVTGAAACTFFSRVQVTSRSSSSTSSAAVDIMPAESLVLAACPSSTTVPTTPTPTISAPATCSSTGTMNMTVTGQPNAAVLIRRYAAGDPNPSNVGSGTLNGAGSASVATTIDPGTFTYKATYAANTAVESTGVSVTNPCTGDSGSGSSGSGSSGSGSGSGSGDTVPPVTTTAPSTTAPEPVTTIAVSSNLGKMSKLCRASKFRVSITRKGAKRVDFMVGKHVYATAKKASRSGKFSAIIDPLRLTPGLHTLKAKIVVKGRKKAQVKKLQTFRSCNYSCASRRHFKIRIPKVKGETVVRGVVFVNHKQVKVVTGARLTAPVDLRGLPHGRFTVDVSAFTASGKVVRTRRAFHTCTKKIVKKKSAKKHS